MVAIARRRLLARRRKALLLPEDLSFPSGRKKGVKRDTKIAISDRCVSAIKVLALVDEKHWEKFCKSNAHLGKRDWVRYILDQDGIGSCAAESADQLLATMIANDLNLAPPVFNPWFNYQKTSGGRDNGSVIGHNVEDLVERGACPEEVWPRSKGWRTTPSREALRVAKFFRLRKYFYVKTRKEFVSALLQGYCVHFGYTGHAIVAVQYLGNGKILYVNSWDKSWGDNGFGVLSLDKVRYDYGAYGYDTMRTWNPKDWKPKQDQQRLLAAVNAFMVTSQTIARPWSSQREQWRKEMYQKSLQVCGLAL
jgi:hypothetical protein